MLRGTTTFVCDECGHKFEGFEMEWNASVFPAPQRCQDCGSMHPYPRWEWLYKPAYRKIWKQLDERND